VTTAPETPDSPQTAPELGAMPPAVQPASPSANPDGADSSGEDDDNFEIGKNSIPLLFGIPLYSESGQSSWALVNLILGALGLVITVSLIVRGIQKKKRQTRGSAADRGSLPGPSPESRHPARPVWGTVAKIMGIAGVVLFLFTQDIPGTMVLLDFWTIAHLVMIAVQGIAARLMSRGEKGKGGGDSGLWAYGANEKTHV